MLTGVIVGARGVTLPNFLIIGAAKAGTTSLYEYLRQHPDVYMSPLKEPQYYWSEGYAESRWGVRTRDAYERLFDDVAGEKAVGEASPQYINSPTAPGRIAVDLPDVKIIVSLRNPADRAYSYYLGRLRAARERCRVEEAMRPGTHYFETSLYHPRLLRYFEQFGPGRIKIVIFDDLVANTRRIVGELHDFLQIDPTFATNVSLRHNPAAVPRSIRLNEFLCRTAGVVHGLLPSALRNTGFAARAQQSLARQPEPLPPSIRRRLLEEFSDDIAKTAGLIGRDLSHWLA